MYWGVEGRGDSPRWNGGGGGGEGKASVEISLLGFKELYLFIISPPSATLTHFFLAPSDFG